MQSEKLAQQILSTFDSINTENLMKKLKLSIKGENLLLMMLSELGGSSTPGKLIERLDFTGARLSAIIKSLEHKGLVVRQKHIADRRSNIVALTEKGREYYNALREEIVGNALTIIEQLGENDVCEFLRIIKKISEIANNTSDNNNLKNEVRKQNA